MTLEWETLTEIPEELSAILRIERHDSTARFLHVTLPEGTFKFGSDYSSLSLYKPKEPPKKFFAVHNGKSLGPYDSKMIAEADIDAIAADPTEWKIEERQ